MKPTKLDSVMHVLVDVTICFFIGVFIVCLFLHR